MRIVWDNVPELQERVLKLWALGKTAKEISNELKLPGITPNAIWNLTHRLGLRRPPATRTPQKVKAARLIVKEKNIWSEVVIPPEAPRPVLRKGQQVTIMTIETGDCRYPYGNSETLVFCANPVEKKNSYCSHHLTVMRKSTPKKEITE